MKHIFELIALTSIWVIGLKIATADDMIFEKIGQGAKQKAEEGKIIFEVVIVCSWCMPSLYSIIGYLFGLLIGINVTWRLALLYPVVVMGSSLVCGVIWLIIETIISVKNKNEIEARYYMHAEQIAYWDKKREAIKQNNSHSPKNIPYGAENEKRKTTERR